MERARSSFLNLNDATISDIADDERTRSFVPLAKSPADSQAPADTSTPRAAPSIMLPMQQPDLALKHVSIGAQGPLLSFANALSRIQMASVP